MPKAKKRDAGALDLLILIAPERGPNHGYVDRCSQSSTLADVHQPFFGIFFIA